VKARLLSGLFVLAACVLWPAVGVADTPPAVPIQQPANPTNVALDGVSCPTDGMCIAVGSAQNKQYMRSGLIERWNGSQWQIMAAPGLRARRMHPVFLYDVSCSSARSCVLIGARMNDTNHPGPGTPLSERWNGRRWQPVSTAPSPAGVELESLSCTSPTECTAVGSTDLASPTSRAVVERYNGQRWSVSYQAPTSIDGSQLSDLSCPTAATCVAIGSQHLGSGRLSALVLVLRNGRWQTQKIALSKYPVLTGVSCASASNCLVVGTGGNGSGVLTPIARSFDGRSFSPVSVPDATRLDGVSCTSTGSCLITGSIGATLRGRPVADLWNGSSLIPAFSGALGVAACRPTFCMLVGSARRKAAAYRYPLDPSEASSIVGHHGTSPRPSPAPTLKAPAGLPPVPNNSPGEKAAGSYLTRYQQTVERTAACRPRKLFPRRAKPDRGVPDRQLLAALGVLRLPAASGQTPGGVPGLLGSVFVRYIRVAQRHDGTVYTVFPVKGGAVRVSARCDRLLLATVQRDVRQAPERLRAQILRLAHDDFLDDRYRRTHPDEACLSGGGAGCANLLDLESTGLIGSGGSGEQGSTWSYLVPDGVASIVAHYPAEGPKTGFRRRIPAVTITANVINNVAVWNMTNDAGDIFPDHITWRSADGLAVRSVYPS
jgi:hypothetical protein